jgi:hypothetical protein
MLLTVIEIWSTTPTNDKKPNIMRTGKYAEGLVLVTSGLELSVVVDDIVSLILEGLVEVCSVRGARAGDKLFSTTSAKP